MNAFTARIRRLILGPTTEQINEEAVAAGLPGYPIPPMPTTPLTVLAGPGHSRWVLPHGETADEIPLDINRADQAAATAAIAAARYSAPPAVICDGCAHAAHMHPDEDDERPAPSCIGHGPGYACPCTHTCQQINGRDVPAHTYRPGEPVPNSPTEYGDDLTPLHRPDRDTDTPAPAPVSAPPVDPTGDSGVHHLDTTPEMLPTVRKRCETCGGHGYVEATVNGLLNKSLTLIPVDGGDQVIREFYRRLLTAAPQLADLFPADLLSAATRDEASPGAMQRDRLLSALVALADLYGNGVDAMARLDAALARFGRSHAAFQRPDGSVQGATEAEYDAVGAVLLSTFADLVGAAWEPEYTAAWAEAFSYAKTGMLWSQWHSGMTAARYPRRSGDDA